MSAVPVPAPAWQRWGGVPTRALVLASLVPLAGAVAAALVPGALLPVLAFDAALAATALADLGLGWLADRRTAAGLAVDRTFHPVQSVGRAFDVTLVLRNRGAGPLRLRVVDQPPGTSAPEPIALDLGPGDAAELAYPVRVEQRGAWGFGLLTVRWRTPLGLFERQRRYTLPAVVRVYPDFERLREVGLRGRIGSERAPVRTRRRPGGENEFQRLRPYVPGDPYRHVDWKATARHRALVTREFGQESNQNLLLLLDCGRATSGRGADGLATLDHALNAAVLLGQVALQHGDRVGLLAFDREIRVWLPPRGGRRTADRLIRATYDLAPTLEEPDYAGAFRHLETQVKRRSLVVVLTSVLDDVNAALASRMVAALRHRHVAVAVWLRDPGTDALLAGDDPWARAAAADVLLRRQQALRAIERRGALVVDAPADGLTAALLDRYLEVKSRRLL